MHWMATSSASGTAFWKERMNGSMAMGKKEGTLSLHKCLSYATCNSDLICCSLSAPPQKTKGDMLQTCLRDREKDATARERCYRLDSETERKML
eukprot:1160176-Pelagomonas_calceolata.AAC.13